MLDASSPLVPLIREICGIKGRDMPKLEPEIPEPNQPKQRRFVESPAKRKMARAGRRGGKTEGNAIIGAIGFVAGRRVLYGVPTTEQLDKFWNLIKKVFAKDIERGVLYKNETEHLLEVPGTEHRIRGKTCWNADTLRGDYCDLLILDEFQLMAEDTWELVGAPMLLDHDGDAVFTYTPPSLRSRLGSKAKDPQNAAKMFSKAKEEETLAAREGRPPRWETFHWTSHDNPDISKAALSEIASDMTSVGVRMEILAEDVNETHGALWKRKDIDDHRKLNAPEELSRIVVAVDPSATSTGDEAGIVGAGESDGHGYVLEDASIQGSPLTWAKAAVVLYYKLKADRVVAESNNGGEMVALTIAQVDPKVPVTLVHASRGKQTRAEPIAAQYEQGRVHHVGNFGALEDELCLWMPGSSSPNRMDALVWALTDLMLSEKSVPGTVSLGMTMGPQRIDLPEKPKVEVPAEFKWIERV